VVWRRKSVVKKLVVVEGSMVAALSMVG